MTHWGSLADHWTTFVSSTDAIYSMHALYNRTPRLPNKEKKIILQKLEDFKETYVCGDVCLVDDFVTKQNLRCGDFVEGQYFTYAKKTNDWPYEMCQR